MFGPCRLACRRLALAQSVRATPLAFTRCAGRRGATVHVRRATAAIGCSCRRLRRPHAAAARARPARQRRHGGGPGGHERLRSARRARRRLSSRRCKRAEGNRWNVPVTAVAPTTSPTSPTSSITSRRACARTSARVYATGFSGGARMSSLLACRLNARIAAIAPMAGLALARPVRGASLPVLTFHGLADPQNTYDGHATGAAPSGSRACPRRSRVGQATTVAMPTRCSRTRRGRCRRCATRVATDRGAARSGRRARARWVREQVDATAEMWGFFRVHTLTGAR